MGPASGMSLAHNISSSAGCKLTKHLRLGNDQLQCHPTCDIGYGRAKCCHQVCGENTSTLNPMNYINREAHLIHHTLGVIHQKEPT
jgi:hypothetical protein